MKRTALLAVCIAVMIVNGFSCKGADVAALSDAARSGNIDEIEKQIGNGADVNLRWFGRTPLQIAAAEGHRDVAELLLSKGARINEKSMFDKTALDYAEEKARHEMIVFLKAQGGKRGADIK